MTRDDEGQSIDPSAPPSRVAFDLTPLRDADGEPDPSNLFAVGASSAERIHILNPPRRAMTRVDALRLVAWIAVLADLSEAEIVAARRQVVST